MSPIIFRFTIKTETPLLLLLLFLEIKKSNIERTCVSSKKKELNVVEI